MPRKCAQACAQLLLSAAQDSGFVLPDVRHSKVYVQPAHHRKRLLSEFAQVSFIHAEGQHLPGD
eukprot:1773183-Amphidinium_carterae.1